MSKNKQEKVSRLIKVAYFDEETASDYLDITAGGKVASTSEDIKNKSADTTAKLQTSIAAKLAWLPILGASSNAEVGTEFSSSGSSLLKKTLSNTILTDYLTKADTDDNIVKLTNLVITVPENSITFMKMFTPFMAMMRTEETGVDLAKLDEVLVNAKGYYELIGTKDDGNSLILRFNIRAFRNSYGLADLTKMNLMFHAIHVGKTLERNLSVEAEMNVQRGRNSQDHLTAVDVADNKQANCDSRTDVYDVVLAGVVRS